METTNSRFSLVEAYRCYWSKFIESLLKVNTQRQIEISEIYKARPAIPQVDDFKKGS